MSFDSIPLLDLSLAASPVTKPQFLLDLRHALLEVGFLYIKNVGIPAELTAAVVEQAEAFFELPLEEKLKIEMKNAPSFLGYSRLAAEITARATDHREQIDLSTPHPVPLPSQPQSYNLLAPNQWPSSTLLPSFQPTYSSYINLMGEMSISFTSLIAEALGLPPTAFSKYFETATQHKLKIVKYPDLQELGLWKEDMPVPEGQGVGPHKDSMLTSYLLQVTQHRGLQVQNLKGQWIDCPPIPGTLVVAIGQGLEALTQGVCMSTTHRVLSPAPGTGARISVPFFQGVSLDAAFEELSGAANGGIGVIPEEIKEARREVLRRNGGRLDEVEFTFRKGGSAKTLGEATLRNRVKSHPDVGERWYPEILKGIREEQAAEKRNREKALASLQANGENSEVETRTAVEAH